MPLQLYFAETHHTLESLRENVNRELGTSGRCIVVVNEGFDVGGVGERHDGFGHVEYGASRTTAAQAVVNYLNEKGLAVRGQATGQVPGVIQRSVSLHASTVDIDEAYEVGRHAVQVACREGTGWMATIVRKPGPAYAAGYDRIGLETVANSARFLPKHWIAADGVDVTDDFVRYAAPLIGTEHPPVPLEKGLQRFARLDIRFVDAKLPAYRPCGSGAERRARRGGRRARRATRSRTGTRACRDRAPRRRSRPGRRRRRCRRPASLPARGCAGRSPATAWRCP